VSKVADVDHHGLECKAFLKLVRPLIAQARRRHNEHAVGSAPCAELGRHKACLHGFPEADFVGQQHTTASAADESESRFELVRQEIHAGAHGAVKATWRRFASDGRTAGAPPPAKGHASWLLPAFQSHDDVEGPEHPADTAQV
jgi:hypothetical protein